MDESIQVASIIDKLPSTWKDVKKNLKHRKDDLSLKDLGKHLLIEEQYHLKNKTNDDTSTVHVVEEKGESSKAGGKKRKYDDKDKKKSKKNKKDVIWYNCKKPGHFKRQCCALKKKQDGGNDNKNKDNNFVAMISEAFSLFKTYEPSDSMLYMGNHSTVQVKGKGKIDLVFTSGNTLTLKNVLHVPDVRKNLVSGSFLNKFGFKLVFEYDKFIISNGGKFFGKGYHTSEMFKLNIKDVVNSSVNDVNMTEISDTNDASAALYRPHQNGIAKEKNRILMDMVTFMMSHYGLNSGYWGEAFLIACYILNRVPRKRSIKTPYELWNRKTPKLTIFEYGDVGGIGEKRHMGSVGEVRECLCTDGVQDDSVDEG
nr:zinc finger, CCHC-type [Tanacetum cinerariifolium]